MLNKITEPQAIYSKAPTPGQPTNSSFTTPPKKKSKVNWKIAGSIVAVCLVAVVGVAGILIAQRQQADQSPVAPNAPESRPSAAIPEGTACSVSFEVKPLTSPPPGAADCVSKTATLVGTGTQRTALAANAKVRPGSTIEYTITIGTKADTTHVDIRDAFPTAYLDYVAGSAKLDGAAITVNAAEIGRNILVYGYDVPAAKRGQQQKLTYQVKVKEGLTGGEFFNHADIKFNNNTASQDSCEINLGVQAPAGVANCLSKKAFKVDGSEYGAATTTANIPLAKRGDVITYKIIVRANDETGGPVVVKDVLPNHLTYQPGSARIGTKTPTATEFPAPTGQTLTFNLGTMANTTANRELELSYKATVKADAEVSQFNNSVTVTTNGKPSANALACQSTLRVAPVGSAVCKSKEAFTDYNGTKIANDSVVQKGTQFVYRLTVAATETTSGAVTVVDTLPSSLEFIESKDNTLQHSNGKLTANLGTIGDTANNSTKVFEYKVEVKDDAAPGKFENSVNVTTAGSTGQGDSCKLTLHVPYQCDSTCTTDAECNNNGSTTSYICSEEAGNKCRRASNPESASCSSQETEYSCNSSCTSDSQCQEEDEDYICAETSQGDRCRHKDYPTNASCDAPSTPTPTPAIGCNDSCVSNADCTNPSHICYNDGTSQVCRLETNPTSNTCTIPGTPGQPQLPQELPQTGPEDWVNWLKAGLITLGIGAALLLLL